MKKSAFFFFVILLSISSFAKDSTFYFTRSDNYWKDFSPLTSGIKCPVLVRTGDKDYAIGPNHYQSFRFPHQTVIHYIGGHAPFQEEP